LPFPIPFRSFGYSKKVKKAFSILLLAIFLFNLGGYYVLFWALKAQADQELAIKLDEGDYDENETFEIKIPITLPYPLQSNGYERQTGQFVYKQEHYQLVKQKYENDTLTIVCLKDKQTKHLTRVMDSFSEASGNTEADGTLNISLKMFQEYVHAISTSICCMNGWVLPITQSIYFGNYSLVAPSNPSPPPWG
jgi:cbb3-type cytochrome oxidase subunit 3